MIYVNGPKCGLHTDRRRLTGVRIPVNILKLLQNIEEQTDTTSVGTARN